MAWRFVTKDESNSSLVWDDEFDTDSAALEEVKRTIEADGIDVVSPGDLVRWIAGNVRDAQNGLLYRFKMSRFGEKAALTPLTACLNVASPTASLTSRPR